MKMVIKKYDTDLLFGIVSGFNNRHFMLADIDEGTMKDILERVGRVCLGKHKLGDCYIIKTGKGWHVVNFTHELRLREYVDILKELKCDKNYIYWVKKVRYGVLRISRRSSHWNVPYLAGVLVSPYRMKKEHEVKKATYFGLIDIEKNFKSVQRVSVLYERKYKLEKLGNKESSSLRRSIKESNRRSRDGNAK